MRTTDSSTSRAATIMRSASSSMITNRYGYGSILRSLPGGGITLPARTALLKSSIWRKPNVAKSSYRRSISRTTQVSASAAFLGLVIIGVIKCGIFSYAVSSTRLGSIRTSRTSSGVDRIKMETIMALIIEDLPAPVAPATNKCGILAKFAQTKLPSTSLPSATNIGW